MRRDAKSKVAEFVSLKVYALDPLISILMLDIDVQMLIVSYMINDLPVNLTLENIKTLDFLSVAHT